MDPILIIDDEKDILEALQRLLRGHYQTTITTSPFEALKLIQDHEYHVIVSDQRMPEMTGVEFFEKAKKLCPMSTRILLTGYTDMDSVVDSINRGQIYRYISKPFENEDFKITLRQANEAYLLRKEIADKNTRLSAALEELTLLDKAKARFLSLVSHELNTPLTVLNSFIQLLASHSGELSPDLKTSVQALEKANSRFSEIVQEVLTFVRIESQNKTATKAQSLKTLIESAKAGISSSLNHKKINLSIQNDTQLNLDPENGPLLFNLLLQDLVNRSPANSSLQFSGTKAGGKTSVSMSGPGADLPEGAFQSFETATEIMHHQQNLGLKLAICRAIIHKHGGKIEKVAGGSVLVF